LLGASRIGSVSALDYLRRSDIDWSQLVELLPAAAAIEPAVGFQIEVRAKYQGYIARQNTAIERLSRMEGKLIPASLDYAAAAGLGNEAGQKLKTFTPRSRGQAMRIGGITPADVTLISVHLQRG